MTRSISLPAQAKRLPSRPNLEYLKKLAKERLRSLRAADASVKLADAQLAVAREHGFASWRALKAHVDSAMAAAASATSGASDELSAKVAAFLAAAVSHSTDEKPIALHRAETLLAEDPRIASADLLTACVLGNAKAASELLERNPNSATELAGPKKWPPMLYLCFSRYLHFRPKLENQFVRVAQMLLNNGADPNSLFVHEDFNETALYGAAGISNRPKLTRLLLNAGADPNDRSDRSGNESLYHACEHTDNACLKLLLSKKPRPDAVSYCLARKLDFEDYAGAKLMLDHGADPNYRGPVGDDRVLHAIRRGRSAAIIKLLHDHGGKLDVADASGMTPLKLARRLGQSETVRFLLSTGVNDAPDLREQFLAACAAGNRRVALKLLKQEPDLVTRLGPDELRILPDAAAANHIWPVRHMLDLGFDINAKGDWGGAAIHHAVYNGHVAMVKFLIHRGAELHQKNNFGGNALGTALHGAIHGRHKNGPQIVLVVATAMNIADMTPYLKAALDSADPHLIEAMQAVAAKKTKALRTSKNWKPIMDASFRGDGAAVRKLLKAGADPNAISTTAHRYRPLHRAIESKKLTPRGPEHEDVVQALLEGGADPTLRGGFSQLTALQLAAIDGPRFIPLLRNRFEPLDIFYACAVGDDARVAELLAHDPKLASARDVNDWTPLHYCCASATHKLGKAQSDALVRIAQLLLKHGADPAAAYHFEGDWPLTPLYHACGQQNNAPLAELLMKAGVSPFDGESVYHSADEGHSECLALLEKYADKKKLAKECTNAIGGLLHWNRSRAVPWLLAHGADPNALHRIYGDSALHSAVKRKSNDQIVRLLLEHGADPARKNSEQKSAIDLAKGTPRLLKLLRASPARRKRS